MVTRFPTDVIRQLELPNLKNPIDTDMQSTESDSGDPLMLAIDAQISHVWMVRTFLKHSDEASDDDELASVHRDLYDFMLALGPALDAGDAAGYLKIAKKKLAKLRKATQLFQEIQPEVSGHTNFKMAARSLALACGAIEQLLGPSQASPTADA